MLGNKKAKLLHLAYDRDGMAKALKNTKSPGKPPAITQGQLDL